MATVILWILLLILAIYGHMIDYSWLWNDKFVYKTLVEHVAIYADIICQYSASIYSQGEDPGSFPSDEKCSNCGEQVGDPQHSSENLHPGKENHQIE